MFLLNSITSEPHSTIPRPSVPSGYHALCCCCWTVALASRRGLWSASLIRLFCSSVRNSSLAVVNRFLFSVRPFILLLVSSWAVPGSTDADDLILKIIIILYVELVSSQTRYSVPSSLPRLQCANNIRGPRVVSVVAYPPARDII